MTSVMKSKFPSRPIVRRNTGEFMLENFRKRVNDDPQAVAFIDAETRNSVKYSQLIDVTLRVAQFLHKRGFGYQDVGCAVLPNSWHFVPLMIGCHLNGGTFSGASTLFTEFEYARQFKDSSVRVVFTERQYAKTVITAASKTETVKLVVLVDSTSAAKEISGVGVIPFSDALKTEPMDERQRVRGVPDRDLALLLYSSGTTGVPKGVELSHTAITTSIDFMTNHMLTNVWDKLALRMKPHEFTTGIWLPQYHIFGFLVQMAALQVGAISVVVRKFHVNTFLSVLQDYKICQAAVVPPMLVILSKSPQVDKYDLSHLQILTSGAAPAGREIIESIQRRLPKIRQIGQGFGMTELGAASHMPVVDTEDIDSCGRLIANGEAKIVDENGKPVQIGELGELCVRTATMMSGYLNRPDATREAFTEDGFVRTGDIARFDSTGGTYIVDRKKELIKVKGLQVAPAELEDLLLSDPRIKDCAVVGIKDARSGQLPKAFIVRSDSSLTEEDVAKYVAVRAAPYKHLKGGVVFIDEIPKSPTGKILRRVLAETETKRSKL